MSTIMARLREDHANMTKLLDALERQIEIFDSGGSPDYGIVSGILDYCMSYPDLYHHPTEDLIMDAIVAKDADRQKELDDLQADHRRLAADTRELADAVGQVLADQEVSRSWFGTVARKLLDDYRHHLTWENEGFFSNAEACLGADDWAAIESRLQADIDPLFGGKARDRFKTLRDELLALDLYYRTP